MSTSKRPQNICGPHGHTWFPRGKDVSTRCPVCGSPDVRLLFAPPSRAVGSPPATTFALGCLVLVSAIVLAGGVVAGVKLLGNRSGKADHRKLSDVVGPTQSDPVPLPTDSGSSLTPTTRRTQTIQENSYENVEGGIARSGPSDSFAVAANKGGVGMSYEKRSPNPVFLLSGSDAHPIPMAVDGTVLGMYIRAASRSDYKSTEFMLSSGNVLLARTAVEVSLESQSDSAAYVRIREGKYAGKLLAVEPTRLSGSVPRLIP